MAGYSARQSTFTTGDTITAAHSNNEFNAILAAFHVSTGHKHDGSTAGDGGPISTLFSNAISMGTGADTDIAVTFNANSNDGVITWMEDEDYFQFSDDLLLSTTEKIQFRDTAIYINSSTDGQLDLVADTEIQIAATTVDINGNVDISGSLTLGGTTITSTGAELNILDGVTATAAELNILDGVTSTTAELNILDGVTSTAAELNILDGVTSTAAELNIVDGITPGTVSASKAVIVDSNKDLTGLRNLTITGDLTISGDDLTMATNTAGHLLIADGTNYNPTAVTDLSEISSVASGDVLLAVDASGGGLKKITRSTLVAGLATSSGIANLAEDSTPQLGGDLDVNGNGLVSTSNGNIALTPNGTGVVRIDGNVDIQTGEIVLKNGGSVSNIKFYCESSNAHYTQFQSAAHSDYSGNVTLTLPAATDTLVGRATTDTLTNKTLTSPVLNTGVSGTAIADEDDMSSNSATKLATQQSIKAYVDAQITAEDLDITSDSGTIAIDLDSETLTIAGGTGLASSASSNTVTLAIDSTVTTLTGSQTLTNKTLTSPVINTGVSGTAILDEDNLASDSASKLATQQSIKAYVDSSTTGMVTTTGSQTLTNKTLTSPVLNTGVSGTAVLDEDDLSSDSATKLATQQSIKAYVDNNSGGGGSVDLTAEGSITAGKAVIMEADGEVKQVGGTIGSTITTPTQLHFPLWMGGTQSHQSRAANNYYDLSQIFNPHTGISWFYNRQPGQSYETDQSTSPTATDTGGKIFGFTVDRDGNYDTITPVSLGFSTSFGAQLVAIPNTDIQVVWVVESSVNYALIAFRYVNGEFEFGAKTSVSGITTSSFTGAASGSIVWDESADAGVATAGKYTSSTFGEMQSVVWTIDKETLAITAGSLQDVGTTTGEVGYTGAGAYTGSSHAALVYDEDTEQVVHVRSYRYNQGTGDLDGYVGKVTGGTTRSIVWGSKQTIYDQTGTHSYDRPMHAIYDKVSNRLIVAFQDTNSDSGDADNWRLDVVNVTIGSDKTLTVNGNTNVTDSSQKGGVAPRMVYIDAISKYMIAYMKVHNSGATGYRQVNYKTFTTSGTSFSFDSEVQVSSTSNFQKSTTPWHVNNLCYDAANCMIPHAAIYNAQASALKGIALYHITIDSLTTNLEPSKVVGLAAASVSDNATVTINVTGGINENLTGLVKGMGVYVDRLGNIRQRVENSSVVDKGLVYLGKALAANKVLMRSVNDDLNPVSSSGPGVVKIFGNKLPALDGERLTNIRDNFIPELKNVTPSRFIFGDAATTHQINIPGSYNQGENPAFYTLQMLISDRGNGANKYHIRFNNDSGTNYYNSQFYTSGGNISSQNTPGGYQNGTDSYFDSVGAQDANVNDKKSFCWIKFTFQNRQQFDYPYNIEDLVGGGTDRGTYKIADDDDRFIDGYLDGNTPGRWTPAWWDSVHIPGDIASNSNGSDYRIRRVNGIGLWQYSTTGATDVTRIDVLSGNSINFEVRYALFAHSIDGSYKAIDYD